MPYHFCLSVKQKTLKRTTESIAGQDGRKEILPINVGRNMKCNSLFENNLEIPIKTKYIHILYFILHTHTHRLPSSNFISRNLTHRNTKLLVNKDRCTSLFTEALFKVGKKTEQRVNSHQLGDTSKKLGYSHTMKYYAVI